MDARVWNRLADGREAAASAVRSKLLRLKDAEKIFCPLTAPNIWELRKQAGASLYRTAELMEQLSENVAFRQLDQLASNEVDRSEEHTSELQSLMRISYAVFCLKKKNNKH